MRTSLKCAIAALNMIVVLAVLSGVVSAHHGRAGYSEPSTVSGTVTSVEWKNPHCFINFDVKDDKGLLSIGLANYLPANHAGCRCEQKHAQTWR